MPITITCEQCGRVVTRPKGDEGRGRFCSVRCGRAAQPFPDRATRFWRKVRKGDGCWEWIGGRRPAPFDYGVLSTGPRSHVIHELAHRISYELHYGPIPDGLDILHHCDNPPCVRPDHLFAGTQGDNNRDRDAKGRQRAPRRLTEYMVMEIRRRRANGERLRVLAADYNSTTGHISSIARRRWWRHLP